MREFQRLILAVSISTVVLTSPIADTCTNILVTPGATTDGSVFISYAADAHDFYGELVYRPARDHYPGAMREIVEWDTGDHLGRIPEVPHTFAVVGNMNEHQVAVGETTFGGRKELTEHASGLLDYGSLMFLALERARTAREAIRIIADLVDEHGYCSAGESFSISDPDEVWILEIIGKGKGETGALWVARKIPDGTISAHANQSRIETFPLDDPETCLYADDVISFARERGWYEGPDTGFSFSAVYAPLDFGGARFCEARVWSVFRRAAPSRAFGPEYVDGHHLETRLPLWIEPDSKLSVADVMALMRDHFEGTPFDLSRGVGAGPFSCPYRWRPMTWELGDARYLNERAISTQQTGFSFVAQSRASLPDPIGGVFWFGVDDTASTVYVPMYCGIQDIPRAYGPGVASLTEFSWNSAFWVFNWVANFAYSRYSDMIVDIRKVQGELEGRFLAQQAQIDGAALSLYEQSPRLAIDYLTEYSVECGRRVVDRWRNLGQDLLVKYVDGNVKDEHGEVLHPRYPDHWYRRMVEESGDNRRMPAQQEE